MLKQESFYSEKKFYGGKRFPHGLARCGEFTHPQVALLETHGYAYEALQNGTREPQNKEERDFLAVCKGTRQPTTAHEKVWTLFCQKTNGRHTVSAFGSTHANKCDASADATDTDPDDDRL